MYKRQSTNGNTSGNTSGNTNGKTNGKVNANANASADANTAAAAAVAATAVREMHMKALMLAAVSGFARAAELTEVSLDLSNACRTGILWSLRVTESMPNELMDHLRPGSSMAVLRPVVKTRLERPRSIVKILVDANHDVTSASWPSSLKHLEFGPRFNRAVEGMMLPDGLVTLSFGVTFNQVRGGNCKKTSVCVLFLFLLGLYMFLFSCFFFLVNCFFQSDIFCLCFFDFFPRLFRRFLFFLFFSRSRRAW